MSYLLSINGPVAHLTRENEMQITKKKLSYGLYEIIRDGQQVATVEKIVDTGEPIWELTILDGTPYRQTRSGRTIDEFVALSSAIDYYKYQRNQVERGQ